MGIQPAFLIQSVLLSLSHLSLNVFNLSPPPQKKNQKQALTPQALPPPPPQLSADEALEASEMAKKYSRAKMAAHRQRQRDLSQKLQLKLAAVAALPEGPLRDAALEPDYTPFPSSRAVWTDTPPIAGFASGGGMGGSGESKDDAGARPVGAGRRRK